MRALAIVSTAALALVLIIGAGLAWMALRGGISARMEPSNLEIQLAGKGRLFGLREFRDKKNPVPSTQEIVAEGRAHFADHCAGCHANNGSGDTEMGRHLYPRAPDMRLPATQTLTDGELFGIIENGIRLTGMPAWGDQSAESQRSSWYLVDFIRHLPQLTPAETLEMEQLNPRGPDEWREQQDENNFIHGAAGSPAAPPPTMHAHH
jgi:mono/diheme cytochrome c family protein